MWGFVFVVEYGGIGELVGVYWGWVESFYWGLGFVWGGWVFGYIEGVRGSSG